jgi:prepilin-type N-terminal cleavage/methylation domain-containing protein
VKKFQISKGFTLIELLVVIGLLFIGSVVGVVSFSQFRSAQELEVSVDDIVSALNTAKINAIAQKFPSTCTQQLLKYGVKITLATNTYAIWAYCGGRSYYLGDKDLPGGLNFDIGTSGEVIFLVGKGTSSGGTIKVKSTDKTKTIQIDASGNITVI